MKPNNPILWFVLFTGLFFALQYFVFSGNSSTLSQLGYSLFIGLSVLAGLYGMEKIRVNWLNNSG